MSRSLLSLIGNAAKAEKRALAHIAWAAGTWAVRNDKGWPMVAIRYVADGAGVSSRTASRALRSFAHSMGCSRHAGHLTLIPDAIAACWLVAQQGMAEGWVQEPAVSRADLPVEQHPVAITGPRGKMRCPCAAHARGDRNPSLLFDTNTNLATCMVTRSVYRIEGSTLVLARSGPRTKAQPGTPLPATPPIDTHGAGTARTGVPWGRHLNGSIKARFRRGLAYTWRQDTISEAPNLGRALGWCDRQYNGPVSVERALDAADRGKLRELCGYPAATPVDLPDRLWSLERHVVTEWRRLGDLPVAVPVAFRATGTDVVLMDLDGTLDLGECPDQAAVERVLSCASDMPSVLEVASIVRTSRNGLQVALRLRHFHRDIGAFYASKRTRTDLRRIGKSIRAAAGVGGTIDESCWAPGRWARRPGVRIKGSEVHHARLWYAKDS